MSLFEDINPRALKDLLAEILSRTMVLPDFQRDFVWESGATRELIISIANNHPARSLLRVRDGKRVFAVREFEGAPFHELHDPRGLAEDVTNLGRWGHGDVEVSVSDPEELSYVLGLVRQAFERQMGNGEGES